MTIDYLKLIPIIVSSLGFLISCLAFWNARKSRMETKDAALFKLKHETIILAAEIVQSAQNIVNEQNNFIKIAKKYLPPSEHDYFDNTVISGNVAFMNQFLKDAKSRDDSLHENFDTLTFEQVRMYIQFFQRHKIQISDLHLNFKKFTDDLETEIKERSLLN